MSEQETMECTRGCDGGWSGDVYDYTKKTGGAAYLSKYGYQAKVTRGCQANGDRVPKSKTTSWINLDRNNPDGMRDFVYNYGPVWIAMNLDNGFGDYKSGVFSGCSRAQNCCHHAMLVVGFGEENGTKYWIVKNSVSDLNLQNKFESE